MAQGSGRAQAAILGGIAAFVVYVFLVLALADAVTGHHWAIDLLYFAAAGVLWAFPAARLIRWVHEGRGRG